MAHQNKPAIEKLAVYKTDIYPGRPTIIFLHDSLGCIRLWRDFPDMLGELCRCNVLVYDRQGYGESCPFSYTVRTNDYMEWEADILMNLITYHHITDPVLFGHSDGGSIALIAAGKYPNRFRGLITEGAHIFVEEVTLQGIEEARHLYETTDLPRRLHNYHGDKTGAMFRAWADTWTKPSFREWNIEHFLPAITCPALIIQGEDDEYGTLDQVHRTVEGIGESARPLILPGVKHTPHKEVPERILEEASAFIDSIPG